MTIFITFHKNWVFNRTSQCESVTHKPGCDFCIRNAQDDDHSPLMFRGSTTLSCETLKATWSPQLQTHVSRISLHLYLQRCRALISHPFASQLHHIHTTNSVWHVSTNTCLQLSTFLWRQILMSLNMPLSFILHFNTPRIFL